MAAPIKSIACFPPVKSSFAPNPNQVQKSNVRVFSHGTLNLTLFNGIKKLIRSPTRLHAALTEIEPDLQEDPIDQYRTNGVSAEDFQYGIYDGMHTFDEGDVGEYKGFWGEAYANYKSMEPPTGFQGLISWLFLPVVLGCVIFDVPGEYMYIGAALFVIVFCIIEMDKPDQPHNFEPQIYNMERGARDKLIADYNSMDIWDFNEKYGDLWDFTLRKDEIVKR